MVMRIVGFLFGIITLISAHRVIVNTNLGEIEGRIEISRAERQFFAFYGIPYAEAPIGEFRFEDPIPPEPWEGVRNCTVPTSPCLSIERGIDMFGQEDCLYLNLYTPQLISPEPLPVLVFVYGGRFMFGNSSPSRYGPHYFMDRDVIVITFNYRLGVLGFLSLEDEHLPGNYGLKDFAAVLRWIQEHIHTFNGDPNKVTIAGGSSGGATTAFALISPLTKGLFHRCISHSVPPDRIMRGGVARRHALHLAERLGCRGDPADIVSCLKDLPAEMLTKENFAFYPKFPLGLVIENEKNPGAFLVDTMDRLLSRNSDIPWIIGINSDEGGMNAIYTYYGNLESPYELAANFEKVFPAIIFRDDYEETTAFKEIAHRLKERYFGPADIENCPICYAKMLDLIFLPVLKRYLQLYRGPKYVYYYAHRNEESFSESYGNPDPDLDFGVIHGDELISLFNWSEVIKPVTEGLDLVVSEQMLDLWTNFIYNGDPNWTEENVWTPSTSQWIEYLRIGNGLLEMMEGLLVEEYEFLDELYSLVGKIGDEL